MLTVATDRGDFVLDNLEGEILAWNDTPYAWVEWQDPTQPTGWAAVNA